MSDDIGAQLLHKLLSLRDSAITSWRGSFKTNSDFWKRLAKRERKAAFIGAGLVLFGIIMTALEVAFTHPPTSVIATRIFSWFPVTVWFCVSCYEYRKSCQLYAEALWETAEFEQCMLLSLIHI